MRCDSILTLNALQKQREFIEFKRQGQQGVQSSPPKDNDNSQKDILELMDDPKPSSQSKKKAAAVSKKSPAKPIQGQSSLDFFVKRQGKKQTAPVIQNEVDKAKAITTPTKKKSSIKNPEEEEKPAVELPKKRGRPSTSIKKQTPEPKKAKSGSKKEM